LRTTLARRRPCPAAALGDTRGGGTSARRPAVDAVKAGPARRVLVVASDARMAAPRTALEAAIGDGAAAFLVGSEDVAVAGGAAPAGGGELVDVVGSAGDAFVQPWGEPVVVAYGCLSAGRASGWR